MCFVSSPRSAQFRALSAPLPLSPFIRHAPPPPAREDPRRVGAALPAPLKGRSLRPFHGGLLPPNRGRLRLLRHPGDRVPRYVLTPDAARGPPCGWSLVPLPFPIFGAGLTASRTPFGAHPEASTARGRRASNPLFLAGDGVRASPKGRGPGAGECSCPPLRVARETVAGPPVMAQGFPAFTAACALCRHLGTCGHTQLPKLLEAPLMEPAPLVEFCFGGMFITVPPCISPGGSPSSLQFCLCAHLSLSITPRKS